MEQVSEIKAYINSKSMMTHLEESAAELKNGETTLVKFLKLVECEKDKELALAAAAMMCEVSKSVYKTTEDVSNRITFLQNVFKCKEACKVYMDSSVKLLLNMQFFSDPANYFPYYQEVYVANNTDLDVVVDELGLEDYDEQDLYPLYIYIDGEIHHMHSIMHGYSNTFKKGDQQDG